MEFFCVGFVVLFGVVAMAVLAGIPYGIVVFLSDGSAMWHAQSHADEALAAWACGDRKRSLEKLHSAVFSATVASKRLRFVTGRWIVAQHIHGRPYAREVLELYDVTYAKKK